MTHLELFIQEEMHRVDGVLIRLSDFFDRFQSWLELTDDKGEWTKHKVRSELPFWAAYGRSAKDNHVLYWKSFLDS